MPGHVWRCELTLPEVEEEDGEGEQEEGVEGRGEDEKKNKDATQDWDLTCCRLRLACRAEPSFSSCFTLILTISCRNFSLDSLESRPESSACLRLSSSDSRPGSAEVTSGAAAAGGVAVAEVGVGVGGAGPLGRVGWAGPSAGELRSLAELLDEVKDGEDSEDSEDVTVGGKRGHSLR